MYCVVCIVHMVVLELRADIASIYACGFVETDGTCRRGRSNFIIVSRNRQVDMPAGVLALYAYQVTSLCLDGFDAEFHNITPPTCKPVAVSHSRLHEYIHDNRGCTVIGVVGGTAVFLRQR